MYVRAYVRVYVFNCLCVWLVWGCLCVNFHQGHQGKPLCEGDTLNEGDSCAGKRWPDSKSLCWQVTCAKNRTKWWQEPAVPGGMEGNEIRGVGRLRSQRNWRALQGLWLWIIAYGALLEEFDLQADIWSATKCSDLHFKSTAFVEG